MQLEHKICIFWLLSSSFLRHGVDAQETSEIRTSILDAGEPEKDLDARKPIKIGDIIIPGNYNKLEIPRSKSDEELVDIEVAVLIRGIGDVDELEEEITMEMDLTVMWYDIVISEANRHLFKHSNGTDEELVNSTRTMDPAFLQYIWKPDVFIENLVTLERPAIIVKPIKLRFNPVGLVIFSTRLTTTIDCEMEFAYYPADTQKCDIKIRSYSHTDKEMQLSWLTPKGVYIMDRKEHNFDIQVTNMTSYTIKEAQEWIYENYVEEYTTLQFTILARRSLSYHMIQTYLPSLFFIVITWLCFLIPVGMVEARIGVAMTTLLTLTSMFASVRESTPIVSYIKAIDVWMVACIFFVFSTLLEFTILVFMRHGDDNDEDEAETLENGDVIEPPKEIDTHPKQPTVNLNESFFVRLRNLRKRATAKVTKRRRLQRRQTALWIEKYALLIFFLTFLVFLSIYWPWLLISSNYFSWHVDPIYNADEE